MKDILREFEVEGFFFDYVHLHARFQTKNTVLSQTCFYDRCIRQFGEGTGKEIPGDSARHKAAWILNHGDKERRNCRSGVLNGWARDMGGQNWMKYSPMQNWAYFIAPGILQITALYRILGVAPKVFSGIADQMSPMLFHKIKERPTTWVGDYVTWLGDLVGIDKLGSKSEDLNQEQSEDLNQEQSEDLNQEQSEDLNQGLNEVYKSKSEYLNYTQIWPIVQSHNSPGIVSPEEFREVMLEGSRAPASGIMMFSE